MNTVSIVMGLIAASAGFIAGYATKSAVIQRQLTLRQKAIDEEMDRRIDAVALRYRALREKRMHEKIKDLLE